MSHPSSPTPKGAAAPAKPLLAKVSAKELEDLKVRLRKRLLGVSTLAEAAQSFADLLFESFGPTLPLLRVYATVPLDRLPVRERGFADALAASKGLSRRVHGQTPTLCLMGTRGALPLWNDRKNSKDHLAIPLADSAFVASVPMVGTLLSELGVDLSWFDAPSGIFARRLVGGFNGLFYVPDARTTQDAQGRRVIPAQSFVESQAVRTVFGMGGAYLGGTMIAMIFFTRESLTRAEADQFASFASVFKMGTSSIVAAGTLFN